MKRMLITFDHDNDYDTVLRLLTEAEEEGELSEPISAREIEEKYVGDIA